MEPTCVRVSARPGFLDHGLAKGAYHFVNGFNNLKHFVIRYLAVAVNVVQLKGPVELVLHLAPASNTQGADKLLEVNGAGAVAVKDVEYIVGKRARIAKRKELAVNLLKLLLAEQTRGAVLEETCRSFN